MPTYKVLETNNAGKTENELLNQWKAGKLSGYNHNKIIAFKSTEARGADIKNFALYFSNKYNGANISWNKKYKNWKDIPNEVRASILEDLKEALKKENISIPEADAATTINSTKGFSLTFLRKNNDGTLKYCVGLNLPLLKAANPGLSEAQTANFAATATGPSVNESEGNFFDYQSISSANISSVNGLTAFSIYRFSDIQNFAQICAK